MGHYYVNGLKRLPTLAVSQTDDLKIDTGEERVWLSRCTTADGEPFNNKVTIERLIDGRWEVVQEKPAYGGGYKNGRYIVHSDEWYTKEKH